MLPLLDTALRHQAWLLSLKAPSEQSWSSLHSFIENNKTVLSEADAKYMDVGTRHDLAALSWREKEVLSLWMEEYLRKLFKKRVRRLTMPQKAYVVTITLTALKG